MITPWSFASGASRAQTVRLSSAFSYDSMPKLDFVGSTADVSFFQNDSTINIKSVTPIRGVGNVRTKGNTVELSGVGCGQLIELCLHTCDGKTTKAKFTMKGADTCL